VLAVFAAATVPVASAGQARAGWEVDVMSIGSARARRSAAASAVAVATLLVVVGLVLTAGASARPRAFSPNVSVFASELNNPRGLVFGRDGYLYVAEGGLGGAATTTAAQCQQVPPPVGPYSGGFTSSISKISPTGVRTTVADGLPSSLTSPLLGNLVSGVSAVAFVGNQLYALEAGAGCSHGLAGTANTVFRVNGDGTTTQVADPSAFVMAHPVATPDLGDFEPDGTWYSMLALRGGLYVVEPNHEEIDRVNPQTGAISRIVDMSSDPWWGPSSLTYHGNVFVGNLGTFPVVPASEQVRKLTPAGSFTTWASGLTTMLGLAFDRHDRMYVLESMTAPGFPGPAELGTGQVVQVDPNGHQTVIATGLSFPTAMTVGPDGDLYVSNLGFSGPIPGLGQILRITVAG
jgi:hypothetical protein